MNSQAESKCHQLWDVCIGGFWQRCGCGCCDDSFWGASELALRHKLRICKWVQCTRSIARKYWQSQGANKGVSSWKPHFQGENGPKNAYLRVRCPCIMHYAILLCFSYVFYDTEPKSNALLELCIMRLCVMTILTVPFLIHGDLQIKKPHLISTFPFSSTSKKNNQDL